MSLHGRVLRVRQVKSLLVDWKVVSSRDVLREGILDRSITLPQVHDFIISPRMDRGLSEEGVDNISDLLLYSGHVSSWTNNLFIDNNNFSFSRLDPFFSLVE